MYGGRPPWYPFLAPRHVDGAFRAGSCKARDATAAARVCALQPHPLGAVADASGRRDDARGQLAERLWTPSLGELAAHVAAA